MIVDNSIVIIDNYMELMGEGVSRWNASITSAVHFFKSIFSATLAISITFFPFLITLTAMVRDFVNSFPWAITIVLFVSLLVAELLIPFMQYLFIKKPIQTAAPGDGKKRRRSFLDLLQSTYNRLITSCFAHPRLTLLVGVVSVGVGLWLMTKVPQRLLPYAERNQFAVEIYLPTGTAVEKTASVADSLEHILRADDRVLSVASFIGCASPRFQSSYAPQPGGTNYAQFIVNTTGNDATVAILDEYTARYRTAWPEAIVRFKQLQYSEAAYPIEVRLSGDNIADLRYDADRVKTLLSGNPNLNLVQDNFKEPLTASTVRLDEEASTRLGLSNADLETTLALRYGPGISVGTVWENDYDINVVVKSTRADSSTFDNLRDEQIPIAAGLATVPLRQVAGLEPTVTPGQIVRRNGIPTITVMAEVERGVNIMNETNKVVAQLKDFDFTPGVSCVFGGELEEAEEQMPHIMTALIIAVCIIYFILVWHFKRILTATLLLCCLTLCFFGTALGVLIQGVEFGMTAVLGLISLMGIIVRNGIIMIDYAEELRVREKMSIRDAIFHSAQRRMRPIFLTSAAASMGVIPMILGGSTLWMPMGTVIFYGTLITMFFILTIIPIAYWAVLTGTIKRYLTGVFVGTKLFKRRIG
jgi:multidrug efflux pump subunit AcrB